MDKKEKAKYIFKMLKNHQLSLDIAEAMLLRLVDVTVSDLQELEQQTIIPLRKPILFKEEDLNKRLQDLDFHPYNKRIQNSFFIERMSTVKELIGCTEKELSRNYGMGPRHLNKVKEVLGQMNLQLVSK